MDWLTVGLLLFTGAQVWLAHRGEVTRLRERQADELAATAARDRLHDQAFQAIWAEHFRIDGLADRWESADLVEEWLLGVLRPDTVLSSEWPRIVQTFTTLSPEAGYLGGVAYSLAHDIATAIGAFGATISNIGDNLDLPERVKYVRKIVGDALKPQEDAIRKSTRELALLMWDALQHSPRASVIRHLNFVDTLSSELGQRAVKALVKRADEAASLPPTGKE